MHIEHNIYLGVLTTPYIILRALYAHYCRTCHIAGEFIRRLQRKQPELGITDREVLLVEIAALCHDLGESAGGYYF